MATVLLNGEPIGVGGRFPRVGDVGHSFMLVDANLKDISLARFAGVRKIMAVVPSLDSAIGLNIARKLESMADRFENAIILVVSVDTPYALTRVQALEDFQKVLLLCTLRGRDFHKDYGVMITDIPLSGLMATALIAMDENDMVLYAELVHDINREPDYQAMEDAVRIPMPRQL